MKRRDSNLTVRTRSCMVNMRSPAERAKHASGRRRRVRGQGAAHRRPGVPAGGAEPLTGNFGDRALIGEGSYGRVYRAKLGSGELVAVKMFDNGSSSGQSEAEFCEQLSVVSRLKCEHFTQLLGYCLELNNRIVLYQFATMGSLYDILHGKAWYIAVAAKQPILNV